MSSMSRMNMVLGAYIGDGHSWGGIGRRARIIRNKLEGAALPVIYAIDMLPSEDIDEIRRLHQRTRGW